MNWLALPPATPPRTTLPVVTEAAPGFPGWAIALIVCGCLIPFIAIMAALLLPALVSARMKAQQISCMNNMKQIGLAFRIWENDNGDQFPFNVSTNKAGSQESVALGADRFDQNSWRSFQVMSNELGNSPVILSLPADPSKTRAADFSHLQAGNVTYEIRSGSKVPDASPGAVLAICPIHHTVLFADGHVELMTEDRMKNLLAQPESMGR